MFGLKFDYKEFIYNLMESLLKETEGSLLLIPHTFAPKGHVESDPDACREVWEKLRGQYSDRIHIVEGEYDQCEIKGINGMCDFFIGSRMHACIAALSQGIPTVGVAYSRKFKGVFGSIGVEDMVLDAKVTDEEEAIKSILSWIQNSEKLGPLLREKVDRAKVDIKTAFHKLLEGDSRKI